MPLIAIAALDHRRVIGFQGKLPWHLPGDLRFFKETTMGKPVLMGRKTYESIGKPLSGRVNLVLSRSWAEKDVPPGVLLLRSVAELSRHCPPEATVCLIGGGELFQELLPRCHELLLTQVEGEHEGDVFFPEYEQQFACIDSWVRNGPGYHVERWRNKSAQPDEAGDESAHLSSPGSF